MIIIALPRRCCNFFHLKYPVVPCRKKGEKSDGKPFKIKDKCVILDLCKIVSSAGAAKTGNKRGNDMFRIFQEEKGIAIAMGVFWALSIFVRVLLGFFYQNMIKEAENMATTDHKLLKQCKLKFANCYQLNNGMPNVSVFVDKFLGRLAVGPFSFETLYHFSGQLLLLSVVCAGIGICKSIVGGRMLGEILPFYIVSFLELYLYFSIASMLDVNGRKRNLKVTLVDYLENHLSARIGVTENDMELLYGESATGACSRRKGAGSRAGRGRRTVEFMPISNRTSAQKEDREEEELPVTEKASFDTQELEELLQEFLTT